MDNFKFNTQSSSHWVHKSSHFCVSSTKHVWCLSQSQHFVHYYGQGSHVVSFLWIFNISPLHPFPSFLSLCPWYLSLSSCSISFLQSSCLLSVSHIYRSPYKPSWFLSIVLDMIDNVHKYFKVFQNCTHFAKSYWKVFSTVGILFFFFELCFIIHFLP